MTAYGPLTSDIFSGYHGYLAKFDPDGKPLWSKLLGDAKEKPSIASTAIFVVGGDVLVQGCLDGTIDFGNGPLTGSGTTGFLARFDADGKPLWGKLLDGLVAVDDKSGNVIVAGDDPMLTGIPGNYVVKLDAYGKPLWSKRLDFEDFVMLSSVSVSDEEVVVTGNLGQQTTEPSTCASFSLFVAKLSDPGNISWLKCFDGTGQVRSTTVDSKRNIVMAGELKGEVDFGDGALTSEDYVEVFVAKFDEYGTHLWSKRFGDGKSVEPHIAADAAGNILITGTFVLKLDFGSGPLTSAGDADIFLAKLSP